MTTSISAAPCRACASRGGRTWNGDDPRCAFTSGRFDTDNWNCASLAELRNYADTGGLVIYNDDSRAVALRFSQRSDDGDDEISGVLFLGWYKSPGRTEAAMVYDDGAQASPSTREQIDAAVRALVPYALVS